MKNVLAVIATIVIVAACAYGIYKQVDDFNKKNNPDISYQEKAHRILF